MTPPCHNRPAYVRGYYRHGLNPNNGEPIRVWVSSEWFKDRCAVWDGVGIGPNGERYPQAHGWDCSGCRWLPEEFA